MNAVLVTMRANVKPGRAKYDAPAGLREQFYGSWPSIEAEFDESTESLLLSADFVRFYHEWLMDLGSASDSVLLALWRRYWNTRSIEEAYLYELLLSRHGSPLWLLQQLSEELKRAKGDEEVLQWARQARHLLKGLPPATKANWWSVLDLAAKFRSASQGQLSVLKSLRMAWQSHRKQRTLTPVELEQANNLRHEVDLILSPWREP